ncbi:MAG: hypothetical protein Q8941_23735 [Bacteroidota bacterium]|nr:hypothetical protein [Bacteroidota bacterium]
MDILITYDLAEKAGQVSKHTAVKDGMKALGYMEKFNSTDEQTKVTTTYYLPNTTLWKKEITSTQAKNDILNVAKQNGAEVERLIATKFESWAAIPGKPYSK